MIIELVAPKTQLIQPRVRHVRKNNTHAHGKQLWSILGNKLQYSTQINNDYPHSHTVSFLQLY